MTSFVPQQNPQKKKKTSNQPNCSILSEPKFVIYFCNLLIFFCQANQKKTSQHFCWIVLYLRMIRIAEKSQASLRISVHRDVSRRPKTRVFTPKWWFSEGNLLISGKSTVGWWNIVIWSDLIQLLPSDPGSDWPPTGLVTLENHSKPPWMVETKKRSLVISEFERLESEHQHHRS